MTRSRARTRPLALTLALALASACVGLNFGNDEQCKDACKNALICGFLPSALGHGATEAEALADCERLCRASPRDEGTADLLECLSFRSEDDGLVDTDWCDDRDHRNYVAGKVCGFSETCLKDDPGKTRVLGDVDLEVALISLADFDYIYGNGAAVTLYEDLDADREAGFVRSCNVGLCGPQHCSQYDDESVCEPVLCGLESLPIRRACNDLSVLAIDLVVDQYGRDKPARQTLLDEASATTCKESSLVFDSATYHIKPGPLRASARVTGILPAAMLKQIDYDVGAASDDELVEYCLEFVGMNMLGRAGEGLVLVPFGDIEEILAYLTDRDVTIPRCDR